MLIAFGKAITRNSNAIPDDIWQRLKARYDEPTLVNLVAFAGIMIATAIFNNAVKIDIDSELGPFLRASGFPRNS